MRIYSKFATWGIIALLSSLSAGVMTLPVAQAASEVTLTASGLKIIDNKIGSGVSPKIGQT